MTTWEFVLRLALAVGLGVAVGLERQWRQRSAGLRTNTLVSLGSAAFTLISQVLTDADGGAYRGDATRIIGQIVTGIGFLGAGVIMKDGATIRGLNTAATVWCSAAVGAAVGAGLYAEGSIIAAAIVLAHLVLRPLSLKIGGMPAAGTDEPTGSYSYYFKIRCREQVENHLRVLIVSALRADPHLHLHSLRSSDADNPAYTYIEAEIAAEGRHDTEMETLAGKLTIEYGVTEVSWTIAEPSDD